MSELPPYLDNHPEGAIIQVTARPGGSRNAILGPQGDALKVMVTQVPEKGKANQVLCDVLADCLGIRKSQIQLLNGKTSRKKLFLVRGVSAQELSEKFR